MPETDELTAGIEVLLRALDKLKDYEGEYHSLRYHEKHVAQAKDELAIRKRAYENAIACLEQEERELRARRRETAQIINDLGKLGCPEEVLKKATSPFNNHDVAEWIKAK